MENFWVYFILIWMVGFPAATISLLSERTKLKKILSATEEQLVAKEKEVTTFTKDTIPRKDAIIAELEQKAGALSQKVKQLSPYQTIFNIDEAIAERKEALRKKYEEANEKFQQQVTAARAKVTQEFQQARRDRAQAVEQGKEIVATAEREAQTVTEKARELVAREAELRAAVKAMENIISGYDDEYLIPTNTFLDDLAAEYDFKQAGQELKRAREKVKMMVRTQLAAQSDYTQLEQKANAIRFVVDAFNGKVDTIMAKIRHDNYGILKQQIIDAFSVVNNNGAAFRNTQVTPEYLDARLDELKWAVATQELLVRDREEQKRIKQEMREEERARREYEKALKETEREERLIEEAMAKVRAEMAVASAEQLEQYDAQLREMEEKLRIAEEKNQRALSMAQQTRSGHVYVISNIGSFGKDVLKIGMTRRLEPLDRVKELGDASVPFPFDVHAMIYSEDAPRLEYELHSRFCSHQVNKVNPRKEFFRVNIGDVRSAIQNVGIEDIHWTMRAEAREFRESIAIMEKEESIGPVAAPEHLDFEAAVTV